MRQGGAWAGPSMLVGAFGAEEASFGVRLGVPSASMPPPFASGARSVSELPSALHGSSIPGGPKGAPGGGQGLPPSTPFSPASGNGSVPRRTASRATTHAELHDVVPEQSTQARRAGQRASMPDAPASQQRDFLLPSSNASKRASASAEGGRGKKQRNDAAAPDSARTLTAEQSSGTVKATDHWCALVVIWIPSRDLQRPGAAAWAPLNAGRRLGHRSTSWDSRKPGPWAAALPGRSGSTSTVVPWRCEQQH